MKKEEIYNYCKDILQISNVKMNEPMSKHTSFKIGGNSDIFITTDSVDEIKKILKFAKENNINTYVIGNGSNILVKDNGIRGIVIKINIKNIKIEQNKSILENIDNNSVKVTVGAGVQLGFLARELLKNKIGGFEFASGIPGTIGGAIRMNAGAYGKEFKDIVETTKCIDYDGNEVIFSNADQEFSYRKSIFCSKKFIIIESTLKLSLESNISEIEKKMNDNLELRKQKQPINFPSAGSTFKRGDDFITAKLIDECGLKGYAVGGAQVSELHAGFIINKGNATAKDVLDLITYVKACVLNKFNKKIELEVEVIGE